jgi:hypothetical protein
VAKHKVEEYAGEARLATELATLVAEKAALLHATRR